MRAGATGDRNKEATERAQLVCSPEQVLRFFRELSIMLGAGIPLAQAIDGLASTNEDEIMSWVLRDVLDRVVSGHTLSTALRAYPRIFPGVGVAMVELGETTGRLTPALAQLAVWMERDLDVRKRVGSALIYPTFCLVMTLGLTLLLFNLVIPSFLVMLSSMGVALPWPTRLLLVITSFLTSPLGWGVMLLAVAATVTGSRAFLMQQGGRRAVTPLLFAVPVVGPLVLCGTLARYAAAAEMMSHSGTELLRIAHLSALASGNGLLLDDVRSMTASLSQGDSLSRHMETHPDLYPRIFAQFCSVGEESARMAEMFAFLRVYYEDEMNHRLKTATSMLEPLVMATLAGIVGFVAVSLLWPLHSLIANLG